MMKISNVFVRAKLEYASQVWNPHHVYLIEKIEKIQRKFTKCLPETDDVVNVDARNSMEFNLLNISWTLDWKMETEELKSIGSLLYWNNTS